MRWWPPVARISSFLLGGACIEAVHYAGIERDANMQITTRRITGPVDRQILDAFEFLKLTIFSQP